MNHWSRRRNQLFRNARYNDNQAALSAPASHSGAFAAKPAFDVNKYVQLARLNKLQLIAPILVLIRWEKDVPTGNVKSMFTMYKHCLYHLY